MKKIPTDSHDNNRFNNIITVFHDPEPGKTCRQNSLSLVSCLKPLASLLLIVGTLMLISCEKDDPEPGRQGYAAGVFISCEGAFNANNGSISWYNRDSAEVVNNLFLKTNARPAGDVVQSFTTAGDYGVLVANNSGKIEIVAIETFESTATISGFSYPRHFIYAGDGTGYLSNGSLNGEVYRINLVNGAVTDTIEVGMGPEKMTLSGDKLFVANSGGWGYDNTVSVIDISAGKVTATVEAGDVPVAVVTDRNGDVWVLCRGMVIYNDMWTEIIDETDSKLVRININTLEADMHIVTGKTGDGFNPTWLTISPDGSTLYFGEADGAYKMSIDETALPPQKWTDKILSAAAEDPVTGRIFATRIRDYSSPGVLYIFDDEGSTTTFETGIAPGGIAFVD